MILNVDIEGVWDNEDIDIEELYGLYWVLSEEDMAEAITVAVAAVALDHEVQFDKIVPDYVEDGDSNELSIVSATGWIEKLGKFAWHVLRKSDSSDDWSKYFAYVDNQHWLHTDFDDLSKIDDEFREEFDGDYEEYAKNYMRDQGEGLPSHLERYFDYAEYGEELLDDENVIEWGYRNYIFSK